MFIKFLIPHFPQNLSNDEKERERESLWFFSFPDPKCQICEVKICWHIDQEMHEIKPAPAQVLIVK